mgnify:CR=1 FL=1
MITFEDIKNNAEINAYIRAADKLSAYIKCLTELSSGNGDFKKAAATLRDTLGALAAETEELSYFMEHFIEGYGLTVDEL